MTILSIPQLADALQRHTHSPNRYKTVLLYSPALHRIAAVIDMLQQTIRPCETLDGLLLSVSPIAPLLSDPIEAKYWLQQRLSGRPFTLMRRFEWLIAMWSEEEQRNWFTFLARLETTAAVVFCHSLPLNADLWQPLASLEPPNSLALSVPQKARFLL